MQMCKCADGSAQNSFDLHICTSKNLHIIWPRSTMDSIRVSEAPDPGSIPGEATIHTKLKRFKRNKNASNFILISASDD